MRSRVCAKWLFVAVSLGVSLLACQPDVVTPTFMAPQTCTASGMMLCICPGGESTGYIPCGADRMVTECGGCAAPRQIGAAGSGVGQMRGALGGVPPTAAGAAGSFGSAPAPAPIAGVGAVPPPAPATPIAGGPAVLPVAGAPAVQPPVPVPVAPAAGACAVGEVCKVSAAGMRFCSPNPAAVAPPTCAQAAAACGTNLTGTCVDGTTAGSPGILFCIHPSCT